MRTLGTLVLSSRPLSWINTAFPFGLAYYVLTERVDQVLVVGFVFFLIPYNLLMYGINDVFDYESDLRNPRKGGVEGALLPPALHRITLITSVLVPLPFLVLLVMWGSFSASAVLALSLFFVIAYSAKGVRFKEIPFLDSMTSSAHFVMPAVYAIVFVGEGVSSLELLLLASFFFWGMASHAFGAVQDVVADRHAGVGSIATVVGAKATVRFAAVLYVLAGGASACDPVAASPDRPRCPALSRHHFTLVECLDEAAEEANRGWKWFLLLNFVAGAVVVLVLFEWWQVNP